jgi:hypothetical protein
VTKHTSALKVILLHLWTVRLEGGGGVSGCIFWGEGEVQLMVLKIQHASMSSVTI